VVLTADHRLYGWGWNELEQLGRQCGERLEIATDCSTSTTQAVAAGGGALTDDTLAEPALGVLCLSPQEMCVRLPVGQTGTVIDLVCGWWHTSLVIAGA